MSEEEKKEKQRIRDKIRYENNKEKIKQQNKKWREQNKEKIKLRKAELYLEKKEEYLLRHKNWVENNKEHLLAYNREYFKNRSKIDILFCLKDRVRGLIKDSFKNTNYRKKSKTEQILGCTFEEFKIYLESNFENWMNWGNKGNWNGQPTEINIAWDIDHIIPLSTATCEADIIKLNHYTNLQPLCSYTNRYIKKNKASVN